MLNARLHAARAGLPSIPHLVAVTAPRSILGKDLACVRHDSFALVRLWHAAGVNSEQVQRLRTLGKSRLAGIEYRPRQLMHVGRYKVEKVLKAGHTDSTAVSRYCLGRICLRRFRSLRARKETCRARPSLAG